MPFSEQHIRDVADAIGREFNEEEQNYIRYHAKRFAFVLNLLGPWIERFRQEHQAKGANPKVRILDVGPHLLTRCLLHYFGDSITINTLGYAHEAIVPMDVIGRHFAFDLNHAQFRARWIQGEEHDIVIMAEVIEHLYTSPVRVLRFIRTQVRDGGVLLVQTPNAAALSKRVDMLGGRNPFELIRETPWNPGHFREYTLSELTAYCEEAGFDCVETYLEDYWPSPGVMGVIQKLFPRLRNGLAVLARRRPGLLQEDGQDSRSPDGLRADLRIDVPEDTALGSEIQGSATVTNTGTAVWLPASADIGAVHLGMQVFDDTGARVLKASLGALREDDGVVRPGEQIKKDFTMPAFDPGAWRVDFDLYADHIAWFQQLGYEPVRRIIRAH
jgi:Methyltransferase domain